MSMFKDLFIKNTTREFDAMMRGIKTEHLSRQFMDYVFKGEIIVPHSLKEMLIYNIIDRDMYDSIAEEMIRKCDKDKVGIVRRAYAIEETLEFVMSTGTKLTATS